MVGCVGSVERKGRQFFRSVGSCHLDEGNSQTENILKVVVDAWRLLYDVRRGIEGCHKFVEVREAHILHVQLHVLLLWSYVDAGSEIRNFDLNVSRLGFISHQEKVARLDVTVSYSAA